MNHAQVDWQTASPLWEAALNNEQDRTVFRQPVLLRFAGDNFMEELQKILEQDPGQLENVVAQPETWTEENVGWGKTGNGNIPFRLFHPAHGRFYLVAASLVCKKPGLPDKCIERDNEESVSFVIRRYKDNVEYGWVGEESKFLFNMDASYRDSLNEISDEWSKEFEAKNYPFPADASISDNGTGSQWVIKDKSGQYLYSIHKEDGQLKVYDGVKKGWHEVPSKVVLDREERLPMFAANFKHQDRQRRLLIGFIPVASRETFQAAPQFNTAITSGVDPGDRFEETVVQGMKDLRHTLAYSPNTIDDSQAQEIFLFCLVDFVDFIEEYLGNDPSAIDNLTSESFFKNNTIDIKWKTVLEEIFTKKEDIRLGKIDLDLESLFSQLPTGISIKTVIRRAIDNLKILKHLTSDRKYEYDVDFKDKVEDALYKAPAGNEGTDAAPEVPRLDPQGETYYRIHCIYERPRCKGILPPVVSEATREFQLASYFEPDAPTRPVRIVMPKNVGIASLRKFKKNVAVLISDSLRQKMEQVKDKTVSDLEEGNAGSAGPPFDLGKICSFSIPIVTICALILLMIIVQLLNIVFFWLPFFKVCLPFKLGKE